jgi:hypothetical protein
MKRQTSLEYALPSLHMAFNNNTYTEQLQQMEPLIDRLLETFGDADDVCRVVTDHIRICETEPASPAGGETEPN